jgi:preprotein translocase subunit Sec61beta
MGVVRYWEHEEIGPATGLVVAFLQGGVVE